jgi:TolB protein
MNRRAFLLAPAAAVLLQACLPARVTLPQSPALKWLERKTGRIAIVALDGNILTVDQAGSSQRNVTSDASVSEDGSGVSFYYQFPAWSPDGRSLAFVSIRRTTDAVLGAGAWTAPANGTPPVRVYSSDERVPHFLSWAPDSSRLVFVTATGGTEQLDTVPAEGGAVRILGEGAKFAWRWKHGAADLAVHSMSNSAGAAAEKVSILDSRGVVGDQDLSQTPGDFEAPAWSADGQGIFMAVSENAGSTLYLEDRAGTSGRPLARVEGDATMDLSPDGTRLAWAAPAHSGEESSRKLFVLDLRGTAASPAAASPRSLIGEDFVTAFFWSPDGSKIAYFAPAVAAAGQGSDPLLTLKVLNVRNGSVRTVTTFHPSPYFAGLLQDFSQYAESARVWSPDSRFLLYCSMETDSFDIMVAYADQPIAPRKIADGLMATWSPK